MGSSTVSPRIAYSVIAMSVLLACLLLFSIDEDTHKLSDLFTLENLSAWIIYAIPTFGVCAFMFRRFARKYDRGESLARALVIGIPLSFALVIVLLLSLRQLLY
jgi:hypothetical protein